MTWSTDKYELADSILTQSSLTIDLFGLSVLLVVNPFQDNFAFTCKSFVGDALGLFILIVGQAAFVRGFGP